MLFRIAWILIAIISGSVASADTIPAGSMRPGRDADTFSYTSSSGRTFTALLPKDRQANDFTPIGFTRQPSFVRGAGLLNKNEHALLVYADADVLPPAFTLQYRYGMFYWWDAGVDVGADAGVFQAFVRTRMENLKTRRSEAFLWSNEFSFGYKYHHVNFRDSLRFDDNSLVFTADNSFAWRMGSQRRTALYVLTVFYEDYDVHVPKRRTDYYLMPVILGLETMMSDRMNFFVEAGEAYGFNGMQFADGSTRYARQWFPTARIGIALRTGSSTAVYYARETKPLSRTKETGN
jgi:hypothetical protein